MISFISRSSSSRSRRHHPNSSNPNFYTYYKDPWLRAPSMASLASVSASASRIKPERNDVDADSLRVDTDAIYSQPIDATNQGIYIHSAPSTEQELSQTESQIYADASTGNGHSRAVGIHEMHNTIYSVPQKFNMRGIPVTSIDEEDDVIDHAPALPTRTYSNGDVVSLTEADRSSMREIGYVEPPADYSPSRNHASGNSSDGFSIKSRDTVTAAHAHSSFNGNDPFRPNELSGEELYHTAVFRNSAGTEVNRFKVAPNGSVKSMKSLYKYMETEEPCALDNEINYTFVSSVH